MEKRFQILRIAGTLYKVLAWISLIVGLLSALGALLFGIAGRALIPREYGQFLPGEGVIVGVMGLLFTLLLTALYFVAFYSVGELIYLFLAIEENTRETALWLRGQGARAASPVTEVAPPPHSPF